MYNTMFSEEDILSRASVYVNSEKPIKGVVLCFHGLNCMQYDFELINEKKQWYESGWLVVCPVCGVASWINDASLDYTNTLLDLLWNKYGLDDNAPLVCYGMSMGALAALIYPVLSAKTVWRCIAKYPVCDLAYHRDERSDVKKTLVQAYWDSSFSSWEEMYQSRSPLCLIDKLPYIPYLFLHSFEDTKVSKAHHSDVLVREMKKRGHEVHYVELNGYDHNEPLTQDEVRTIASFLE